jgi:hypothetical protein
MPAKLTDDQANHIRSLRHLPTDDIAKQTGRSKSTISKILNGPKPSTDSKPLTKPSPTPTEVQDEASDLSPLDRLERVLAVLERASAKAETDNDVSRMVAVQRAIGATTALLEKLTPPKPEDPNDRLDMQAEAEAFRKQVWGMFDKFRLEAERA